MKHIFSSKKFWLCVFCVLIAAVVAVYIFSPKDTVPEGVEIGIVSTGSVQEVISETGVVLPTKEVALAFEQSGRITDISVGVGTEVTAGDTLIRLDDAQQTADLNAAIARLQAEEIRLSELENGADTASLAVTQAAVTAAESAVESARRALTDTTAQHDQLVTNAERTLRSASLEAFLQSREPMSSSASYEAPIVSGTYGHTEEGSYLIEVYGSNAPSGASIRVSGLETDTQPVSTVRPVAIGSRGLYRQFPEEFARRTTWEIPIPNTRSANYQSNLNTYNAVVEARELAITQAESALLAAEAGLEQSRSQYAQTAGSARSERIEAQRAVVRQMQAAVEAATIAYKNRALHAPFDGVVTMLDAQAGELSTPAQPIVSVISQEQFEIKVDISESDIEEMNVGDTATVTFDAYDDAEFRAEVISIAPNAVLQDGVRVFEVTLRFVDRDDRIKAGLSADVDILTAIRDNVISIPSRAVAETLEGKFVRTITDGKLVHIPVVIGLRGSDGNSEVIRGLTAGEEIITFADSATLNQLEEH